MVQITYIYIRVIQIPDTGLHQRPTALLIFFSSDEISILAVYRIGGKIIYFCCHIILQPDDSRWILRVLYQYNKRTVRDFRIFFNPRDRGHRQIENNENNEFEFIREMSTKFARELSPTDPSETEFTRKIHRPFQSTPKHRLLAFESLANSIQFAQPYVYSLNNNNYTAGPVSASAQK